MTKKTKVTFETESLLILRGTHSQSAPCSQCGAELDGIALEHAGLVSNLDQKALEAWLASSAMHQVEAADGSTLICLNSLLRSLQGQRPKSQP